MPSVVRSDRRRFPGSELSSRAFALAAARRAELHHAVRVCAAVFATFALTSILHIQGFWAVFTAVIVVQSSTGATIGAVRDRLIGTLVGGLTGAAASVPHLTQLWERSGVLALTVAVLTFAAAVKPTLRVALQGALLRTFEVILGSVVGLGAALLIFPAPARLTALQRASRTMTVLGDLLAQLEERVSGGQPNREAIADSHTRIRGALAGVEAVMTEARREQVARLGEPGPSPVLRTLWRIRNDTVLIDRALREPLPDEVARHLRPATAALLHAGRTYLQACAAAALSPSALSETELNAAHDAFEAQVEDMREERLTSALDFDAAARVFGLIFSLQTLFGNLGDLGERVEELSVRQPRPVWAPLGWS
jgi:uncharacterized membrane protein YccC